MSLSLELPDDLAGALADEAAQLGMTLPEYAVRILSSENRQASSVRTGTDLVAYWKVAGVVGSRSDIADSQAYASHLRELAQSRDFGS